MKTRIVISSLLRENSGVPGAVEVDGKTVGECLEDLKEQYPETREWFGNENSLVEVVVGGKNGEIINLDDEGLKKRLKPGDEIQVMAFVSGG